MDELIKTAKQFTDYDLILEHVKLPEFPELRTKVLRLFLRYAKEKVPQPKLQEAVSIAVSLMQHALDVHEQVNNSDAQRRKQLTVLAGDYYSSRFYQLLSQAGCSQAIDMIAQAVCDVNRMKMNVYAKARNMLLTAEEYLRSKAEMNTHLYAAFTSWLDSVNQRLYSSVLAAFAECEVLVHEFSRLKPEQVKGSWVYWYVIQHGTSEEVEMIRAERIDERKLQSLMRKYNVLGILSEMWESKIAELRSVLAAVESDKLSEELRRLAEPLFAHSQRISVLNVLR